MYICRQMQEKGDRMKRNTGIDIIIPVYNALEDLKLCVDSIKKHTDLNLDRVIIIDDRSPDQEVFPYMKSIEGAGIVVLQNEQNQGFSGTINRGMQYSDRDVLLLNSDTIVTEGWVDKIVACAYSDSAIGTVTPFSNNATLCSVPNFCEENTTPYGLSIDEYARIIERCSMKRYPRITVAVGFCMFIKREVVQQVGLFDKETFQRGYGEENDFCWRAEQLGYYHVLCDDTYIYHSGTGSFLSEEKKRLIAEHEAILQERYPKQLQKNAEYVRDNPHQYLRTNVDIYAKLANGKRNILYVLHMDFRADSSDNIGGTQFHVKDLMMNLRRENNVFVLARDGEMLRLTAYMEQEQRTFAFYVGKRQVFQPFHDAQIAQIFRQVLTAFSIDLVHVHHIADLSFDVFALAKEMGIPLLLTLHDYYYICPTIKLLENGSTYCGGCSDACEKCLHSQLGYAEQVSYMPIWREKCRQALALCDNLIVPSEAAKAVYTAVYPEFAERIRVIPHGMDMFRTEPTAFRKASGQSVEYHIEQAFEGGYSISGWAYQEGKNSRSSDVFVRVEDKEGKSGEYWALTRSRPDVAKAKSCDDYMYSGFTVQIPDGYFASGALKIQLVIRNGGEEFQSDIITVRGYAKREKNRRRIAFLGGLNEAKGSQIAYQMMKQGGNKYDWYIIGGIGDLDLLTLEKGNVFKTGWYKRENVNTILQQNQIDLVCILPIWPETFCYTVSEAELAGVPVLVTDIGALSDRVRQDQTGWLIDSGAAARDALNAIDDIFADEEAYRQVCDRLAKFQHRTIEQMCRDYARLYETFAIPEESGEGFDARGIYNAYVMCQTEHGGSAGVTDVELLRRINELEVTLSTINQSLEYRMVRFFNRENVPFKRQLKWLVGVAYRIYVKFFRK